MQGGVVVAGGRGQAVHARPAATGERRGSEMAELRPDDAPPDARQRLLRSSGRDELPSQVNRRALHALRHHDGVPAHARTPTGRRGRPRDRWPASRSLTDSSADSREKPPDVMFPMMGTGHRLCDQEEVEQDPPRFPRLPRCGRRGPSSGRVVSRRAPAPAVRRRWGTRRPARSRQ